MIKQTVREQLLEVLEMFRLNDEHLLGCHILHNWADTERGRNLRTEHHRWEDCPTEGPHWKCQSQCAVTRAVIERAKREPEISDSRYPKFPGYPFPKAPL